LWEVFPGDARINGRIRLGLWIANPFLVPTARDRGFQRGRDPPIVSMDLRQPSGRKIPQWMPAADD